MFRLAGVLTAGIALMVLVLLGLELWLDPARRGEWGKYVALFAILVGLAALFYIAGRRARAGLKESADA